jgi:sterol desaturase/sphingolipid hydroxylase (fatty acid hydroxylase superfamily)
MPIVVFVFITALIMIGVEIKKPGRNWQKVSNWWARAIVLNLFQVISVFIGAATWNKWFAGKALWNAEAYLGITGGALLGYFVITFIYYWWHRIRHESDFLWRYLHQLHHSPQRIEIITAFYKHPVEILINSVLSSAILYLLVGLGPEASSLAVLLTGLAELVYHWNVKTPYWLGFFFQRPESHCIHHKQGWHRQNFSDLPLWDIIFGTFQNPKEFNESCGFSEGRELQMKEMLLGRDVHKKP